MKIVPNKFWWEYTKGNKADGSYWTLRSNNNVLKDTSVVIQTVNEHHKIFSDNKDVRSGKLKYCVSYYFQQYATTFKKAEKLAFRLLLKSISEKSEVIDFYMKSDNGLAIK